MAKLLGQVAVGSIVKLKENGSLVDFYVAKHDYESGLNGAGRTLVVRKDCYIEREWHNYNTNNYVNSTIKSWLNSDYKNILDANILELIGTTKYYSTPGGGNNGVTVLTDAVFLLSMTELGISKNWYNVEGSVLPIVDTLKITYMTGSPINYWTRSPVTQRTDQSGLLTSTGDENRDYCSYSMGARPVFTLSSTAVVLDDLTVSALPTSPTLTVPSQAMQGQSIPINWTASANADSYQLQRNTGSGWSTIYQL
mgnify:CR=1 FL=1